MTRHLRAAQWYADLGWAVFPCEPRGKRPLGHLAPHGVKDATTDPSRLRGWWEAEPEANVAVATGAISGLFVVDLDGTQGEDAYGLLLAEHHALCDGPQPDGLVVRTPGGGWHMYAALPDGATVPNSAGRIGPRIDVRGDGGYVLAPPSVHPSGGRYVWLDDPRQDALPGPRPWILEAAAKPRVERTANAAPAPVPFHGAGTPYGLAALRGELERLAQAQPGTRNDSLNRASFSAGSLVASGHLDLESAVHALARVGEAIGLHRDEVAATIASGIRAGHQSPRRAEAA